MEKVLAFLAAVLMMFTFATIGFAQGGYDTMGTPQGEPWPEKSHPSHTQLMTYSGQAAFFDRDANRLAVNGSEGRKTFDISRAAINGPVHPDEEVTVQYRPTNNGMVASSVTAAYPRTSSSEGGYGYNGYGPQASSNMGANDYTGYGPNGQARADAETYGYNAYGQNVYGSTS